MPGRERGGARRRGEVGGGKGREREGEEKRGATFEAEWALRKDVGSRASGENA